MPVVLILYLILNIYSGYALACKCETTYLQDLYKNPIQAKTAFVGRSEGVGSGHKFKVLQSWTPYQESISSPNDSPCALKTEPGRLYLVYSLNRVEFIEKRNAGFTICDSVVLEIEDARPTILKFADKRIENDLSPNPTWFYCTDKKECLKEKGLCSESVAVNKKYKERFKHWVAMTGTSVNCITSSSTPTGKISCKENFCDAEVKTFNRLWKKKAKGS